MSIKPETLAWLRQTAKFEGGVTAQAILHLLERVEALEAKDQLDVDAWASMRRASCDYQRRLSNLEAAQQPRQDKLDRLIEQDREADDEPQTLHTIALRMVDTLERLGVIPEIWDTLRRAIREPMEQPTPEAAPVATDEELQNQQFLAHLNRPLTEADRKDLGLPSAELEDGDGIDQFAPEAAPVATDEEQPLPPDIAITYQPKSVYQPLRPAQLPAPHPAPPAALGDALIKAECALSDIAEGEETNAAPNTFEWAEQRCAETLATICPVMQQHGVRTSEWPPVSQPTAVNGSEMPQVASDADGKVIVHCPETCWVEIRRIADGKIIYDNHQKGTLVLPVNESPPAPPAPAGGLVKKVMVAGEIDLEENARAAIREVAAWLDRHGLHGCSLWLREEAGR